MNFLEQLVSEWYSYRGFYVRENVRVGLRDRGGYQGELDVVAFVDYHRGKRAGSRLARGCKNLRPPNTDTRASRRTLRLARPALSEDACPLHSEYQHLTY